VLLDHTDDEELSKAYYHQLTLDVIQHIDKDEAELPVALIDDWLQRCTPPEEYNGEIGGTSHAPRNWEYRGEGRYQNECNLWVRVMGTRVVKYVGNYHVPVSGGEETIGQYDNPVEAREAALEWMAENPDPWDDEKSEEKA
jgi:hypothetical protein